MDEDGRVGQMRAAVRNTIVFLVLSAAAVGTWLVSRPDSRAAGDIPRDQTAPIGYYLKNAVLAGTDDSGRIYYRVYAALLEQASQQDDLVLTQVRVEYADSENVHWHMIADRGIAPYDRAYLDLLDGVRLATVADAGTEQTVIETDRLRLDSESFVASSDGIVSMSRGETKLSATGFRVDLKEDVIELHHNVTGLFHR